MKLGLRGKIHISYHYTAKLYLFLFYRFIPYRLLICMCMVVYLDYSLFKTIMLLPLMDYLLLVVLPCQVSVVSLVKVRYASGDGTVCRKTSGVLNKILQYNSTKLSFILFSSYDTFGHQSLIMWVWRGVQ